MQKDMNFPMVAIVNDLDALITEIDENPHLSSWVVRLVLKSIKDKAKRMATDIPQPEYLNQPIQNKSFKSSSNISYQKIKVLRQGR
ncbi:hypothetical protein H6F74_24080 [Trichocoleus sp. FACHB-90]|uniref:hypothetical protein n=1 Tax=Cyanophyceae TaxID=3028117 RepID=UPI0016853D3A|nr:hypothetical protein [Trichocoleus sp. FACHB-90]MBD1929294.1 hypothetical protein [Trichocoleus sp. FACHB-90]